MKELPKNLQNLELLLSDNCLGSDNENIKFLSDLMK